MQVELRLLMLVVSQLSFALWLNDDFLSVKRIYYFRVAINLENMENLENSGNWKNCQNLRENSGKFEFLWKKPGKLRENVEHVA